jgi:molybdate-binding protein
MADVGFALELPARRFGLDFVPILTERYFFVCRTDFLTEPMGEAILEVLRRPELHALISALPGYDPVDAGRVERVGDVFPIPKRPRAKNAAARLRAPA